MSRLAEIAGLLCVLIGCVLLALAGLDLPWLVLTALCGVCAVAIAAHWGRR